MSVSLRNITGDTVNLGRPDGKLVDPDELITVDGDVSDDSPADAYLIGKGGDARLWPHANWKLDTAPAKKKEV